MINDTFMKLGTYETPCYCVSVKRLQDNLEAFSGAFRNRWGKNAAVAYAIKTNHLKFLLQYALGKGLFAEAASDDEYDHAVRCGFPADRIILNGPQKSDRVMNLAISGSSVVNLDNFGDIDQVERYFHSCTISASERERLRFGLRVNFDLETDCPGETTAGQSVSRFGLCFENGEIERAIRRLHGYGIKIRGFHMHYSTTTRSARVFAALARKVCELIRLYKLKEEITYIDIGGGFWGGRTSKSHPTPDEYAAVLCSTLSECLNPEKVKLMIEPGASVVATAADYRCKVTNVRDIRNVRVVTTDGTTLHINPFQKKRVPAYTINRIRKSDRILKQIVCGNTCLENDRFFETETEPELSVGDEIIIHYAGAYTMAFNSCFIHVPPNVYLEDLQDDVTCIRKRNGQLMAEC